MYSDMIKVRESQPKLDTVECPTITYSRMYIGIPIFKILGATLDCQGNMMTLPLDAAFSSVLLPSSIWSVLERCDHLSSFSLIIEALETASEAARARP